MLTRLYVDNYRCFVNFEYRPTPIQLLMGGNGVGKSTFLEVLHTLKTFVDGSKAGDTFNRGARTRWQQQTTQTFALDVNLSGISYSYKLAIDLPNHEPFAFILSESLLRDGMPLFEFSNDHVSINNGSGTLTVYPADSRRSALAGMARGAVDDFTTWLSKLRCFRLDPFDTNSIADGEDYAPWPSLKNFASWYRHLVQEFPRAQQELESSLQAAIAGFERMSLEASGGNTRTLIVNFEGGNRFTIDELSEGQRCLIYLYTILHFELAQGRTVILDEPENFISLAEIQPWLIAVADTVEEHKGQALIISHHPEIMNYLAVAHGVTFVRDDNGPVRVKTFQPGATGLEPAELVARGWENDED